MFENLKEFLKRGSSREDLVLLGAHPTITPPMWTTLATGAYPVTHGITDFWLQDQNNLGIIKYGFDSRNCKAEQLWNVFAESGKKTFLMHWPVSWPPTSQSENLFVIDGTNPEGVCMGSGQTEGEFIAAAANTIKETSYRRKVGKNSTMCVVDDIVMEEDFTDVFAIANSPDIDLVRLVDDTKVFPQANISLDASLSPIKEAEKWSVALPEGAKELTVLLSGGLINRPCLLIPNENGIYDTLLMYKNKKAAERKNDSAAA